MFRRKLGLLMLATALMVSIAAPASAGGAQVTKGAFTTLQGGIDLGYDITGRATMIRIPGLHGWTIVSVRAGGLDPVTVYPVHVHNAPCSNNPPGGGHYQNVVGGPVDAFNEMWPVVTTNAAGRGNGFAVHGYWARPDAMSIVIHNPANTSIRLACLDLS
jgi:hypothetical protein